MAAPTSVNKRLRSRTFVKVSSVSRLTDEGLHATLRVSSSTRRHSQVCHGHPASEIPLRSAMKQCKDILIHCTEGNELL
jgi:hypothetical protein